MTTSIEEPAPTAVEAKRHNTHADFSTRLAYWVFVAIVVAAVPVILFNLGSYHWFFRDDFFFLSGRKATSLHDLFTPHNAHWSTVPILAFRALYFLFGMRSYVPYQACVVALHLTACVLLRVIMRRVGVGPWIATFAAASFVFFGPGQQNIIWAFQIGFTGSLTFGLTQLVLADHDGPFDVRDWLGVIAGVLSLMSSSVGIAMAVVVGLATFGRRGWKAALVHTSPLAAAYLGWWLVARPKLSTPFGRPDAGVVFRWVRSSVTGVFDALGHYRPVVALLGVVFVVGLFLAWGRLPLSELRRRASLPTAMFIGGLVFSALSSLGRWYNGPEFARSSRYLHICTALALPALAVAMDAIARRWRLLTVPLIALLVVAVPANVDVFEYQTAFGPSYMAARERIVRNVVRVPAARQVPDDVRPIPDVFVSQTFTIGWMLDAVRAGKLRPSRERLTPKLRNEMTIRVAVDQRERGFPVECRTVTGALDLSPTKGTVIGITEPLTIATREGSKQTSRRVTVNPNDGHALMIELDGLELRLAPAASNESFTMCDVLAP